MVKSSIRVFVVDDQALVRRGLVRLLGDEKEIEIVGEAEDGVEALRKIPGARPQVVLVDARMPRMDGVELIGRLSEEHPDVAAIILTTFDEDEYVFGGLRAGAKGYLLKDTSIEELVSAIVKASKGETILGSPIAARLVSNLKMTPASRKEDPSDPAGILSNREVQVAGLVGRGGNQRGDSPRAVHERGHGEEPRLQDPPETRFQGSHPAGCPRRRARLDGAASERPLARTGDASAPSSGGEGKC